jgi:KUP system potassium uptake protein
MTDESARASGEANPNHGAKGGLPFLMLGCIGVVYGDIGTSPLYAMRESLHAASRDGLVREDVLGIVSLLIWTLILIVA